MRALQILIVVVILVKWKTTLAISSGEFNSTLLLNDTSKVDTSSLRLVQYLEWEKVFDWKSALSSKRGMGGEFSTSFEYGFPSDLILNRPGPYNSTITGKLTSAQLGIPLKMEGQFKYFSVRPEIENYFRISLDRDAILKKYDDQLKEKLKSVAEKREELTANRQKAISQLSALNFRDQDIFLNTSNIQGAIHQAHPAIPSNPIDSLNIGVPSIDLSNYNYSNTGISLPDLPVNQSSTSLIDASPLNELKPNAARTDSILIMTKALESRIDSLNNELSSLDMYSQAIQGKDSLVNASVKERPILEKLKAIKQLELGQTNPMYGHFMLGGVSLNGVNLRFEGENRDVFLTHGQVILSDYQSLDRRQNWMRNLMQDALPTLKNIGDRISSGAISISKTSSGSLFFGGLFGIDKHLMDDLSTNDVGNGNMQSRNGVGELFGSRKLHETIMIDYAYSRSFFNGPNRLIGEGYETKWNASKSNAFWTRVTSTWPRLKLELKGEAQLVEKDFRSLANPFLRNDQFRIDGTAKRKWTNFWIAAGIKSVRNNVSGESSVTTELTNYILQTQMKLSKCWVLMLLYLPTELKILSTNSSSIVRNFIQQITATSVYSKRKRDTFYLLSSNFSSFEMKGNQHAKAIDALSSLTIDFKSKYVCTSTIRYNDFKGIDTLTTTNSILISEELLWNCGSKFGVIGGASGQYLLDSSIDWGWKLGMNAIPFKNASIILSAQKILLENYFTEEIQRLYEEFPYRIQVSINYKL